MHVKLALALNSLDIGYIDLLNDEGVVVKKVTAKEHATALFSYLNLGGYLRPDLLAKAVEYLSAEKSFSCSNEDAIHHLTSVCALSCNQDGSFNERIFFENFCNTSHFTVHDIVDLIVFLQQTAFERPHGMERDGLKLNPLLTAHLDKFTTFATDLGVVTPLPPKHRFYCGVAIMGAASSRVKTRIEYFNRLDAQNLGEVWALTGERTLSKGLDEYDVMFAVAESVGKLKEDGTLDFVEEGQASAKRLYLKGVTETMMVHYLLTSLCQGIKIGLIDSQCEAGHWRATTSQNAKDLASVLIKKIQEETMYPNELGEYHFMIIAEQPYAGRMARQVQRELNVVIEKNRLESFVNIIVDGVGPGISEAGLSDLDVLARVNSELGSLMAERFIDYRLHLARDTKLILRNPEILMFNKREARYQTLLQNKQQVSLGNSPKF